MIPQIDKEMIEAVRRRWYWNRKIWVDFPMIESHETLLYKSEMCVEN